MQKQIAKINKQLEKNEQQFQQTKDAKFKTVEALEVLNNELNILKGRTQALLEVKNSLEEALAEKKSKK